MAASPAMIRHQSDYGYQLPYQQQQQQQQQPPSQHQHHRVQQPSQDRQYPFPGPAPSHFQPRAYQDAGASRHLYASPSPAADDTPPLTYRSSPVPSPLPPTPIQQIPPQQGTVNASRPSNLQIHLPAGQTNTLALKTTQLSIAGGACGAGAGGLGGQTNGSTTLYQRAKAILYHLRSLDGFEDNYLSFEPAAALGFEGDLPTAVELVWNCLRLGAPLVHLVNLVGATGVWDAYVDPATGWVPVEGDVVQWPQGRALNWMVEAKANSPNQLKLPLHKALACLFTIKQRGGWPGQTELVLISEILGDDTNAAVKIFHTVSLLLELLPPPPPPAHFAGRPSITGASAVDPLSPVGQYPPNGQHAFHFPPSPPTAFSSHESGQSTASLGQAAAAITPGGFMTGIHAIPGAVTPGGAALMGFGGVSAPPSAFGSGGGPHAAMGEAANLVKELIETERKYIQELEVLHSYMESLVVLDVISANVSHVIFSNLKNLLDFQRKFQISLETEAEKSDAHGWRMGDWGRPFIKHEEDFGVYEPFCANYLVALDTVVAHTDQLQSKPNLILEPVRELPAFLIKPIQRITKYPLLLSSLVKATSESDYAHHASLEQGLLSVKRITDRVNETSRAKENAATKAELEHRVTDWKGHDPDSFGLLLVDDTLIATKGGSDREYHVFLFERMLLCCKDANDKTNRKSNKANGPAPRPMMAGPGFGKTERTELAVKGRIYVNNLTHTETIRRKDGGLGLQLYWRSQDAPDTQASFLLHMRNDEQLQKWDSTVTRLIAKERQAMRERQARMSPRMMPATPVHIPYHRRPSLATSEWGGSNAGNDRTTDGGGGSGSSYYDSHTLTPMPDNPILRPSVPRNMSVASGASSDASFFGNGHPGPSQPRQRASSTSNLRNNSLPYESSPTPPMPTYPRGGGPVPISRQASTDSATNSTSSSVGTGPPPPHTPSCMIRIHYANALHMVKVPRDVDVPELRDRVLKKLCRGHPELETSFIKLTYQDDEDDWLTLHDNFPAEFREHLEMMDPSQQVELRVKVAPR